MMVNHALKYARQGWPVFPVLPGRKAPATPHGVYDATTDVGSIQETWRLSPYANIGVVTGRGFMALDIDVKKDPRWEESLRSLGPIPPTRGVRTPSGGWHYYYLTTLPIRNRVKFLPGLDVRGTGGYVLGAGSAIGGIHYTWINEDCPIAELPADLAEVIQKKASQPTSPPHLAKPLDSKEKEYIVSSLLKKFGGQLYGHSSK